MFSEVGASLSETDNLTESFCVFAAMHPRSEIRSSFSISALSHVCWHIGLSAAAESVVCNAKSVEANTIKNIVAIFIKVGKVALVLMLCFIS